MFGLSPLLLSILLRAWWPAVDSAHDVGGVVARAGEYAVLYEASISAILAEETYVQRDFTAHEPHPTQERVLRSEVLIARLPLDLHWLMYRDVLAVDGRPVTDEKGRLERILRDHPPSDALRRAQALLKESSRFNIGPVQRNFNIPTLALVFLLPGNQARVSFSSGGTAKAEGRTWVVVKATESRRPTLLRSNGVDTPLTLTYWIDADTGGVYRTEVRFSSASGGSRARLVTTFAWSPRVQLWLPSEMTERYDLRVSPERLDSGYYVEGSATYGHVRRFEVTTQEENAIQKPPDP
jgi:hypothetical protein